MPEKKNSQQEIDQNIIEEDKVRLKPFLGMRPGVYLALIYGFVLVLLIFFITIYPGLSKPGTVLTVKTEPQGAAIRLDGIYQQAAPADIFIPKGKHTIEIVSPGFTDYSQEITAGSSVFCSLFFPKRDSIYAELKSTDPEDAFKNAASEYAAWSFYGEATAANQVPLVLSDGAYRLGKYGSDPAVKAGMQGTILGAARFAVTRSCMRDLLRAVFLVDSQGQSPSPVTLLGSLENAVGYLEKNPQTALWLADTLTGEAASRITNSAWYKNAAMAQTAVQAGRIGREVTGFGGLKFS
ncbi:MAG: PEGA domain-containing protein, partial [Treponema sp.]|nr:PEGA domain-containing protein [Treponema sp.]